MWNFGCFAISDCFIQKWMATDSARHLNNACVVIADNQQRQAR